MSRMMKAARYTGPMMTSVAPPPPGRGILGALGGALGGFLTGGIGGAVSGGIRGWKGGSSAMPGTGVSSGPIVGPMGPQRPQRPPVNLPFAGPPGVGTRLPFGGRIGFGETEAAMGVPGTPPPRGYHWNKSSYFLRSGEFVPKGSKLVKNRRRNPLNPRALSRSLSRIESAKKAASTLNRVTVRKKKCG